MPQFRILCDFASVKIIHSNDCDDFNDYDNYDEFVFFSDRKEGARTAEVPLADTKAFICSKCGLQFHQRFRLEGHLKWHEKMIMNSILYTCQKCGIHYKQLSRLKSHIASVHVLKSVLKQGTHGRNRVGHIFRPQLNEENHRQCKETREVTGQDCGDGETDEETDLHRTVEENDRWCSNHDQKYDLKCTNKQTNRRYKNRRNNIKRKVDQYSDEENNQGREHQRSNGNDRQYDHQYEETVHQHIAGESNIKYEDHECTDEGNDQQHGERGVEIGLKINEEYDLNREETDEENDQTCQEGVDYVIEENYQSDEDYQHTNKEIDQNENDPCLQHTYEENDQNKKDPCFNEEIGDDGESFHRFKSTDRRRKRKDTTTASFKAEINPQPIERRSKRHSDLQNTRRSLRISSNTHVDQIRHLGDSQQRKDSADRQGNRQDGRRKRKREGQSTVTNVKKGCQQSGDFGWAEVLKKCVRIFTCSECGRTFVYQSSLRKHLLTHQQMSTDEVFYCRMCRRQYTSLPDLRKHMFDDHGVLPPSKDANVDGRIIPLRYLLIISG